MEQYIVVLITAGSKTEADKLSRGLVEEKLAFCVQCLPGIQSTYTWEGKLCVDQESLLMVKTRSEKFEALEIAQTELDEINESYDNKVTKLED